MPLIVPLKARWLARGVAIASLALAVVLPTGPARADDLLGLYLGGGVGQSRVDADGASFNSSSFKENHSAFKGIIGIRPIPVVGAEVEYIDFGHPRGTLGSLPADVTLKGAAAFGVGYLPLPIGALFVKAGLARLQSTVNGEYVVATPICDPGPCPGPSLFSLSRTDTSFAAGGGIQFKVLSWAIRAEYEHFHAAGGNPGLVSVGFTWTFL